MMSNQEDAIFNFLKNVTEPFTVEDIPGFVQMVNPLRSDKLKKEIESMIDISRMAFKLDNKRWLSRRGFFEKIIFVISPSKLELLNGIFIPGHRCVPFANPVLMPHDYTFFWNGKKIRRTSTEGHPKEFYPYYNIFGEEYAPQYVARDNPENEFAFGYDPFEDPNEISIQTFDMRNIYREAGFVPGDSFIVRTRDWIKGYFDLEKADKSKWLSDSLSEWVKAAEDGFEKSFLLLGPGASTEEQIAYAYWYGEKRMRELPAYSIEEFLYEKNDMIENVTYGIESRFWFAGKDIPDCKGFMGTSSPPDRNAIEDILFKFNVPISEYVVVSYIRDAMFRNNNKPSIDVSEILDRIVPSVIRLPKKERNILITFIEEIIEEFKEHYFISFDKKMGPLRQRAGELHTAVIELAAKLLKTENNLSWLPHHTFIMLSQIQSHTASLLEDLDFDEEPDEAEMETMDYSLDSMIDALNDIKELIKNSVNNYRLNNLMLIQPGSKKTPKETWRSVQISIEGTDIWRKTVIPLNINLKDLHKIIQTIMGWNDSFRHFFYEVFDKKNLDDKINLEILLEQGISELRYEYGAKWNVKIVILAVHKPRKNEMVRCISGEGAVPPEIIGGPMRYKKILDAIESGNDKEKKAALMEIGQDFKPDKFDLDMCNRNLENYDRY